MLVTQDLWLITKTLYVHSYHNTFVMWMQLMYHVAIQIVNTPGIDVHISVFLTIYYEDESSA